MLRNIGVPFAHTILSFKSILKGWAKLEPNVSLIQQDLQNNWQVVAEAIQTILRREQYPQAYEVLKSLTRGNAEINQQALHQFIDSLNISPTVKEELKQITPQNYIGKNPEF